jgi:transposase
MVWRQGQSYSEDLRARVLAAVDGGLAARAAAELFRVSVSYIYKALVRRRRTGQVIASTRRGHRPRKLSPAQEAALAAHIEAHPDLTLATLQAWLLAEHEVRLSNGAMWSAVARLGLSFKKRMARPVRKRRVRSDLTGLRQRIRSRSCRPGQDGGPRALVLIKTTASMRHFLNQVPERRFNRQAISLSPLADISGHQRRLDAGRPILPMPPLRVGRRSWRDKWPWPAAPPRRSGPACWPARQLPCCDGLAHSGRAASCPARRRS